VLVGNFPGLTWSWFVEQAIKPKCDKSRAPFADGYAIDVQRVCNVLVRSSPLGAREDDPRPKRESL